jgi:hypothetical protein
MALLNDAWSGYVQQNLLVANAAGNIGIGNASPAYKLDISGEINATGIRINGTPIATGGASQWTTSGSNIYYNAGNVGVGTTSPDSLAKLHLAGSGGFGQDIQTTTNDWTRLRFVTPARTWGFFLDGGSGGIGTGKFGLYDYTASAWRIVSDTNGNVGISSTAPLQKLQIGNNTSTSTPTPDAMSLGGTYSSVTGTNPKLRLYDNNAGSVYGLGVSANQFDFMTPTGTRYVWNVNGVEKMRLDSSGNVTVAGTIAATYQDMAEWVESSQELAAGTVVVLDQTKSNHVVASSLAYDTRVAGVISSQPGITLGEKGTSKVLVATTGRVKVKVDATGAPIRIGDLLVTSDTEGVAKRSEPLIIGGVQIHRPGTLIGKALEPLSTGTGEILVLLSLQ